MPPVNNSLGKLSPDVVSLRVLDFIKKQFPALSSIGTDFSDEAVLFDQEVTAHIPVVPEVKDYDEDEGYVPGSAAAVKVPVKINRFKHVSMAFNDLTLSSTNRKLIDEQAKGAAYALGSEALGYLSTLITPANFAKSVVEDEVNTSRSTLNALRMKMTGIPQFGRYALMNVPAFGSLADDPRIINVLYQEQKPDYKAGVIYNVQGFDQISEFPDLPSTGNLSGFAGVRQSLVFAARVPADPVNQVPDLPIPGKIEVFKDADSGLSMMARYAYDMQRGKLLMTLTWMYGVAVGNKDFGVRLVTA